MSDSFVGQVSNLPVNSSPCNPSVSFRDGQMIDADKENQPQMHPDEHR
jgi:hypothetical protein